MSLSTDAASIVDRIVGSTDLIGAAEAVEEALAAAGVGTADASFGDSGSITISRAGQDPTAGWYVTALQSLTIAVDGIGRAHGGRLSLWRFATLLCDLGCGVGPDQDLSVLLQQFLTDWLAEAENVPDDAQGMPILLLSELARRQQLPVDLHTTTYQPWTLQLGLLDIELLLAGLVRIIGPIDEPPATGNEPPSVDRFTAAMATSSSDNPCDKIAAWMAQKTVAGGVVGQAGKAAFSELVKQLAKAAGDTAQATLQVLRAVRATLKLTKYIELFTSTVFTLTFDPPGPVQQPDPEQEPFLVSVQARAAVAEPAWQEWLSRHIADNEFNTLKNCLDLSGLPSPPDPNLLANSMKGWRVEWSFLAGTPDFAQLTPEAAGLNQFDPPASFRTDVTVVSDHEVTTSLWIDIQPGSGVTGPQYTAPVRVRGELIASEIPGADVFAGAAWAGFVAGIFGKFSPWGLINSGANIVANFLMEALPPVRVATLPVLYHRGQADFSAEVAIRITVKTVDHYETHTAQEDYRSDRESFGTAVVQLTTNGPSSQDPTRNLTWLPMHANAAFFYNETGHDYGQSSDGTFDETYTGNYCVSGSHDLENVTVQWIVQDVLTGYTLAWGGDSTSIGAVLVDTSVNTSVSTDAQGTHTNVIHGTVSEQGRFTRFAAPTPIQVQRDISPPVSPDSTPPLTGASTTTNTQNPSPGRTVTTTTQMAWHIEYG